MSALNVFKNFITETLAAASETATANFGLVSDVTIKLGDNNQVLTKTDQEIGRLIVGKIKKKFPDHNIIDEEAGIIDNKSSYTWVVDPIDGTSNFANGVPTYGIIIGLIKNDTPIVGGASLPFFKEIIVASNGNGAFCSNQKLKVTEEKNLLKTLVAYGIDGHQENPSMTYKECSKLADIILEIRNLRSSNSVFDIIMVAKGKYGAYLNQTSRIWDNAGLQVIIEEAGGIYTDFFGKPIDYSDPLKKVDQNFTCCISSPQLHQQLQTIIHKQDR
jgi:myo-inositol-1(or 4)-monophosphatase